MRKELETNSSRLQKKERYDDPRTNVLKGKKSSEHKPSKRFTDDLCAISAHQMRHVRMHFQESVPRSKFSRSSAIEQSVSSPPPVFSAIKAVRARILNIYPKKSFPRIVRVAILTFVDALCALPNLRERHTHATVRNLAQEMRTQRLQCVHDCPFANAVWLPLRARIYSLQRAVSRCSQLVRAMIKTLYRRGRFTCTSAIVEVLNCACCECVSMTEMILCLECST